MLRRFSTNFAVFSIVVDLLAIVGCLWGINQLRPWFSSLAFAKPITDPQTIPSQMYIIFPLVWVTVMMIFSVYDGRKNIRIVDEFTSLTLSAIFASITLAGILYLSYRETSRLTFIFFIFSTCLALILWRVIVRIIYRQRNEMQRLGTKVLILGAGPVGRDIETRVVAHNHLNVTLVGFLDDDKRKNHVYADILGDLTCLRAVVTSEQVDTVIISLPSRAYEKITALVKELDDLPVRIWIVPDYFSLALHHTEMEDFLGIPMLDVRAAALTEYQLMVKRIFDLVATTLIMVFALPVMLVVALVIWLDDRGPILYHSRRVGENGKLFDMIKFRTMIPSAEKMQKMVEQYDEQGNLIHKTKDDPRITRIGRFLRRTSLDELPQFFNVLSGNMSLVGPRPELPYLVDKYEPWQRKRFAVPQGLTGWWQIHGRSDKPMHLHTEDDLYYIQNYSIWLDIQILLQTVWIIIRGKGAY
jgi:exopolysaccharide biosynthesis polyprenyl glycosylphosphotransferase